VSGVAVVAVVVLVSGCASATGAGGATAPSTPTQTADGDRWPDGADENTPPCQDASAATLAVVNEAVHAASAEDGTVETTLPWLSVRPDTELGVWTLTGLVVNESTAQGTEGGYFVVWATADDPTSPTFSGTVLTVGGSAGLLAHLPPLLPAYVGPMDADSPAAALKCGTQRMNQN
jgi:hypothetical protein